MTRIRCWSKRGAIIFLLVASVLAIWAYFEVLRPSWILASLGGRYREQDVPREKLRKICHKVLSHRFGNHHDAFIALEAAGNAESIPYLINALRWQRIPSKGGVVICTTAHCTQRLWELTGEWYEYDYSKWDAWWKKTGSKMTPEELTKNVAANKHRFKQKEKRVISKNRETM
jgi:hypothetical protein